MEHAIAYADPIARKYAARPDARVHIADAPVDGKQRCARCRCLLSDGPTHWRNGGLVLVTRTGKLSVTAPDVHGIAKNCGPSIPGSTPYTLTRMPR